MTTQPVNFTAAAVAHIQKMLQQTPQACGFRLAVKATGCSGYSYVPTIVTIIDGNDIHYTVQQQLAIYLDAQSLPLLQGVWVDFTEDETQGLKQKRLTFNNPNEVARCGCGESFTIEK